MDVRQTPPRILYIATWIVVIGVLGALFWLMTVPPIAYAHYQPFFQAAFDLAFGSIFIACGLFYNSWFGTIMGAHNAPVILHFGPNRARIGYIVVGMVFLVLGVTGVLVHM
ncbi:MAG TPA: hypothetical protein VE843_10600 [Ktedonobacteraceae bacterium]|nr:hypothetical protein [Ktedonobacteraceae bacterium]